MTARSRTLRTTVVIIALTGLVGTVVVLTAVTSLLLVSRNRTVLDEDLIRQIQQVGTQTQDVAPSEVQSAAITYVGSSAPSTRITTVVLGPSGPVLAQSEGPRQVAEAIADDPARISRVTASDSPRSLQLGDTRLRYLAIDLADGTRVVSLASEDDSRDAAVQTAAMVGAAGLVCVLAGALWTAWALRRAVDPLRELSAATRQLGEDTSERLAVPAEPSEVRALASELNALLDRIDAEQDKRNTFLATVAHELRTPLTIARGYLENLERYGAEDQADAQRTAAVSAAEIARAGRMVEALLTLARAEQPGFVVVRETNLERFADDLAIRLEGFNAAISVAPPPSVTALMDTERLSQAVLNAVWNSLSHNDTTVRVRITWHVDENALTIYVDDDGVGFPEQPAAEDLLEPFAHGALGTSGLGLAVIAAVTRAHGGDVDLSTSPQGGARVAMWMPIHIGSASTSNSPPSTP